MCVVKVDLVVFWFFVNVFLVVKNVILDISNFNNDSNFVWDLFDYEDFEGYEVVWRFMNVL